MFLDLNKIHVKLIFKTIVNLYPNFDIYFKHFLSLFIIAPIWLPMNLRTENDGKAKLVLVWDVSLCF